jgi:hypothetical protein
MQRMGTAHQPAYEDTLEEPDVTEPTDHTTELQRLREQNARLQGRLDAVHQPEPTPPPRQRQYVEYDATAEDLTEDERSTYGDAASTVAKLSRKEMQKLLQDVLPQINQRFAELDEKFATVGESVVANTQQSFMDKVNAAFPDLNTMRNTPKFNTFINAEPPEGLAGVTRRQILQNAWHRQDFPTVKKVIDAYRAHAGTAAPTTTPDQFTRPSAAQRQPVRRTPTPGPGLKTSEWASLRQARMANRVTQATFAEREAAFKAAQRDGSLIDDVGYMNPRQSEISDKAS